VCVEQGHDRYNAARMLSDRLTASRFRSQARRDPEFAARYAEAKRVREEARLARRS
jgi:hypothetical protein